MIKKQSGKNKKKYLSLSGKIIIIIIAFVFASSILWSCVMFLNISRNANKNALKDEETYINSVSEKINSVEEVCNLAQQMVLNNYSIIDYIKLVKAGKDYPPIKKIHFYNNEINTIYNMTNINPYLYQVRLFVDADITEKKPYFYNIDRIKNMDWADEIHDSSWKIDYLDKVFPSSINNNIHLAGIISNIKDDNGNTIAVLEVSTRLENLFENFYTKSDSEMCCFVRNNKVYSSKDNNQFLKENKTQILSYINNKNNDKLPFHTDIDGQSCILSVLQVKSLNGYFVHIIKNEKMINSYYHGQITYFIVVLVSIIAFSIIVIVLISNTFKRFNTLTEEVNRIEKGEVVKLTEIGNDEISELGKQINNMLVSLERLNKENTLKQLLVKNAEIRSLQNQINAHFMYNVLETIKMMAEIEEEYEISDAITSLGNMFRYSMQWTSGMVALKDEIKYIRDYLNLLNLRFDYEIYLSLNIPDELLKLKIPKMSLQPLVENSVYHGIENVAQDTSIYIKAFIVDNIVNIEVSDAGVGMSEEKLKQLIENLNSFDGTDDSKEHGRALYNVQQRIKMYFGQEYGLQIFSKEGAYTKVLIQIPLDKNKEIYK